MVTNKTHSHTFDTKKSETLINDLIAAQEQNNLSSVVKISSIIIEQEPNNILARKLFAMYAGWNQKLCTFNKDQATNAIHDFFQAIPNDSPINDAFEIYFTRKEQLIIAAQAQSDMPSFSNAKALHQTMLLWLHFLKHIPYLSSLILENEIVEIKQICLLSKRSIDPKTRLIYTAYTTFNNKIPYNRTFSICLNDTIRNAKLYEQKRINKILEKVEQYKKLLHCSPNSLKEQTSITNSITQLQIDMKIVESLFGIPYYQRKLDQLNAQLLKCKPFFISYRKRLTRSIQIVEEQLSNAKRSASLQTDPISELVRELEPLSK